MLLIILALSVVCIAVQPSSTIQRHSAFVLCSGTPACPHHKIRSILPGSQLLLSLSMGKTDVNDWLSGKIEGQKIKPKEVPRPKEELVLPRMTSVMRKGVILDWKKKVGDKVSWGDPVVTIGTDKADMDLEALHDGYVAKILVPASSKEIDCGTTLALIADREQDIDRVARGEYGRYKKELFGFRRFVRRLLGLA